MGRRRDAATAEAVFTGEIDAGPARIVYTIGGLDPGAHYFACAFVCAAHPNMVGKLTVPSAANP
ncbi:MAG: hypothetical protein WCH74_05300 [Chloroflexota bacterium]